MESVISEGSLKRFLIQQSWAWIWFGSILSIQVHNVTMVTIFQTTQPSTLSLETWLILKRWSVSLKSIILTSCQTWCSIIAQRSMSGSKRHWLGISITKLSSSFRTNQPIGYLNLVVLPGLLLEIQGNTIFTSLMKHRQTSIGVIPMFVRSCSRWSTSGVTRELKVSVSM